MSHLGGCYSICILKKKRFANSGGIGTWPCVTKYYGNHGLNKISFAKILWEICKISSFYVRPQEGISSWAIERFSKNSRWFLKRKKWRCFQWIDSSVDGTSTLDQNDDLNRANNERFCRDQKNFWLIALLKSDDHHR